MKRAVTLRIFDGYFFYHAGLKTVDLQSVLFMLFAFGAIVSALLTVTRKNPVSSAMSLVAHFFMLTGLYLTLQAHFVAAVQVLVYAGAIMVLVVFVIMLLNVGREVQQTSKRSLRTTATVATAAVIAVMLGSSMLSESTGKTNLVKLSQEMGTTEMGTTSSIGKTLFTDYIFPFEAVSLLLLAALIGAVVLAKRHVKEEVQS